MPTVGIAWTPDSFKNKWWSRAGYRFSNFLEGTGANLRLPLNPPFFIESNVNYDARMPGDIRTGFTDVIARGDLTGPRSGPAAAPSIRAAPGISICARRSPTSSTSPSSTNWTSATNDQRRRMSDSAATHLVVPHEANNPLPGAGPFANWAPHQRSPSARRGAAQRRQHRADGIERHQLVQLTAGERRGTDVRRPRTALRLHLLEDRYRQPGLLRLRRP